MSDKYAIFFDLDGTLIVGGKISDLNIEMINKVQSMGNKIILNTGRSRAFIPDIVNHGIKWDGMIAGCSYVEFENKLLVNKTLSNDCVKKVSDYCAYMKLGCRFEGVENLYSNNPKSDDYIGNFLYGSNTDNIELGITKVTIHGLIPISDRNLFDELDIIMMPDYVEGVLKGFNKDTGMKMIAREMGIDTDHVVAFGDSHNDIAMLEYAGISVIIKHALPELDRYASFRTTQSEEGVAEGLRKIFFKE